MEFETTAMVCKVCNTFISKRANESIEEWRKVLAQFESQHRVTCNWKDEEE